jgi:hypothetical protein
MLPVDGLFPYHLSPTGVKADEGPFFCKFVIAKKGDFVDTYIFVFKRDPEPISSQPSFKTGGPRGGQKT